MKIPFNKSNNGTEELNKIATWAAGHEYANKEQQLILAARFVLTIIDVDTYDTIVARYFSDDFESMEEGKSDAILDDAVYQLQRAIVHFAYAKSIDIDSVQWDNSGIQVHWNDSKRPAQADKLAKLEESIEKLGYEWVDFLISILDKNVEKFGKWIDSEIRSMLSSILIDNAVDFDFYYNINKSTSKFFSLFDIIRKVQRNEIIAAVGNTRYWKLINYQKNLVFIRQCENTVNLITDLESLTDVYIALVLEDNTYYTFKNNMWTALCENMADVMNELKPALVELTMFFYWIAKAKDMPEKKLEAIQAMISELKSSAYSNLERLRRYVYAIDNPVQEVVPACEKPTEIIGGDNSIMM